MRIKVESNEDSLELNESIIKAQVAGIKYEFELSRIEAVFIITTDLGPIYDDMCLAIRFDHENDLFIMSEHPDYKVFLFDQLGKKINLDYDQIIAASTCVENNIFKIYVSNEKRM